MSDPFADAMADMLADPDLWEDATIGATTLQVQYHSPGSVVEMFGMPTMVENPTALCGTAAAATLNIVGGPEGTGSELTIRAVDYRVASIKPDGNGFSILDLVKL